jgi:replicative DNA helicase
MRLSAPIYLLKQQAKNLSREENIPLHQALDRIAAREGFRAWSLLSAQATSENPAASLLAQLRPGELILIGSRPGQGKTLLSLELAIHAMRGGSRAAFFTLDYTPTDVAGSFQALGEDLSQFQDRFLIDDSDQICADYIVARLTSTPPRTLVVVDYLQLLDQKREHPDLMYQVQRLRAFARERQVIVACLSQIDRRYEGTGREFPGIGDIRLPNPLDLRLFDRACFLSGGKLQLTAT